MTRARIPSVKEPNGLTRSDGKRPDGLTLIPWCEGRSATWDGIVTNTVAASYLAMSSVRAALAAEAAATRKDNKYIKISLVHLFSPLAFETKLVKISFQSWDVGFLHLLTTHVKPLSCSNVCPSMCSVSMLFHLHTRSVSHNLKQLTYRSKLKHIIEFNKFFYTVCLSSPSL